MEPIDVKTPCKNPEFPTRVRIIDLDGHFEHAGPYTGPKYTFSVEVEVKYNKVVDGKEKNLITCTFWTKTDSSVFSFEDDDLSEDEVEDWFLEGLHDDLSFHDLEGLEKLDLFAQGVPTNEEDECGQDLEASISDVFDECIPDICDGFDCICSDLYRQPVQKVPFTGKELETINGDHKTVWSIEDFDYDIDTDEGEDYVFVSYYVKCSFYIKDKLLYSFEYKTNPDSFMEPCHNLHSTIVQEIEKRDFDEMVSIDKDMSDLCNSFKNFVEILEDEETLESTIKCYVEDELDVDDEEDIDVTLGELAEEWQGEYNNMSDLQRKAFTGEFDGEVEDVVKTLLQYQQKIVMKVEKNPDGEYEEYMEGVLDNPFYAFGLYYKESEYYLCFDNRFGKEIEYEEHGEKSSTPFTEEKIRDYVEYVYGEMLN